MRYFAVAVFLLGAIGVFFYLQKTSLPVHLEPPIIVVEGFARSNGKNAKAGAAFMKILNQTQTDDRLISVSTPAASMAELHTHIEDTNGIMMMREIQGGIEVPTFQEAVLQRGGDHVMLMGLKKGLTDGENITLTLTFQNAGDVEITIPVDNNK